MSKYVVGGAIKEIRFHLSQAADSSNALRSFIIGAYPVLAKNNPELPILVREASVAKPTVFVRFEQGQEVKKSLEGLDKTQIETEMKHLLGL